MRRIAFIHHKSSYRSQLLLECLTEQSKEGEVLLIEGFTESLKPWFKSIAISKYWYYLIYFKQALLKARRFDILFIPDQIFLNKWVAFVMYSLLGKSVMIDFYVSEYDVRVNDRKVLKPNTVKSRWLWTKERLMLKKASKVFFLSKTDMFFHHHVLKIDPSQTINDILPLCPKLRREYTVIENTNERNKFRLVWWGSFNRIHGLEFILESLKIFKQKNERLFTLDIFGSSQSKGRFYERLSNELGLEEEVKFHYDKSFANGTLYNELHKKNFDLSLGLFGDTLKAKNVVSNKLVESIILGIPHYQIVSDALNDFPRLDDIIFTTDLNKETFVNKLEGIYDILKYDKYQTKELKKIGLEVANLYFSKDAMMKSVRRIYEHS